MKPLKYAAFMAIVVLLAACGSTANQPIVVAPPALPAGAPQVSAPTASVVMVPEASGSQVVVTAEADELPRELYASEDEVVVTSSSGPDRVGQIPPDIWPSENVIQGYRNAEKSRPESQRRKYPRHRVCPENTSRRIAPGERVAITRGHVDIVGGWDCRNSSQVRSQSVGKGKFTLPPETGIVMRPGPDGRPDPTQMGWQTGCGNTIYEFLDKNPALFEWYEQDIPVRRAAPVRYAPAPRAAMASMNVSTVPATDISETGAMLHGSVVASGYDGPMNCRFELWRDGAELIYLPWFRLERVNGQPLPFRYWTSNLKHGTRYGYRPFCVAGNLSDYGEPMGFATQRTGYCRRHPYVCSAAIGIGTGLILAGINNDWWRGDDTPNPPGQPPCSGYCTDQPVSPGPTWPGDPGGGTVGPPGQQPGPTWPGTTPPNQPGPGPTWPGNNPSGGNPPSGGQPPTWPPTGNPPTGNPPTNPGPGPTWPPSGGGN